LFITPVTFFTRIVYYPRHLFHPSPFSPKLGQKLFAFNDRLEPLWVYDIPTQWQEYGTHTAYIPTVGDIDGDGRDESPNNTGMEAVWLHGQDRPALIVNGGTLFTGKGTSLGCLPGLPELTMPIAKQERPGWRMAWYHTIPADLCGDAKEEILVYNPWDTDVFIYTAGAVDESAYRGYRPEPRQYNPRLMD